LTSFFASSALAVNEQTTIAAKAPQHAAIKRPRIMSAPELKAGKIPWREKPSPLPCEGERLGAFFVVLRAQIQ
jgi:hypothetical protein